jgi:leader peptidase (prepilin peptidase)/N-methyltransferase
MEIIWTVFLFAFGACVGSFLNVVVWRVPRGESIVFPGSHCPCCGRAIRWFDNIPLVSWLALGARCRDCKARISPRYILVEAAAACLVAGLFLAYYVFRIRGGAGDFLDTWPMFLAHAALLCGLLGCSLIDMDHWIIPLEVCWLVSLVGLAAATASPPPAGYLPRVSPTAGAMAVAAGAGIVISLVLLHYGLLQRSFIDAEDRPRDPSDGSEPSEHPPAPVGVAFTKAHGVDPRREMLREVAFLAPAILLAAAAWHVTRGDSAAAEAWRRLCDGRTSPWLAGHLNALLASVLGYMVGGLWIWGVRVLGTLGFGKEAMGLGDVHLLAAVGAVCGWVVPSLAFFMAAMMALAWAMTVLVFRKQRELPYGPWLAAGTVVVMVLHDRLADWLKPYADVMRLIFG